LSFLLRNGDNLLSDQSEVTLTAAQTIKNLKSNCLSNSILAYSLAHYFGIKAQFNNIHIPKYWALKNGFNLLTGHINLSINTAIKVNICLPRKKADFLFDKNTI